MFRCPVPVPITDWAAVFAPGIQLARSDSDTRVVATHCSQHCTGMKRGATELEPPVEEEEWDDDDEDEAERLIADRSGSWSVLAFGAKWIISGWQQVRCGRPACITTAYLWHNLQLVHRLEDYHGTPIINLHANKHTHALPS